MPFQFTRWRDGCQGDLHKTAFSCKKTARKILSLPFEGRWPGAAGSEGWELKVWNMPEIMGISPYPTFHPSVSFADSSPQGEPWRVPVKGAIRHKGTPGSCMGSRECVVWIILLAAGR